MTVGLIVPPPGVTGWTVTIPMPKWVYADNVGALVGQPVGWLTTNNVATTARGKIRQSKIKQKWRRAAAAAYRDHHVPQGLNCRIEFTVAFAQAVGRLQFHDSPNAEYTVKPIQDALGPNVPTFTTKRLGRSGKTVKVPSTEINGWGIVPNDSDRWVQRGRQQPALPKVPADVGGLVVVTITPCVATPNFQQ